MLAWMTLLLGRAPAQFGVIWQSPVLRLSYECLSVAKQKTLVNTEIYGPCSQSYTSALCASYIVCSELNIGVSSFLQLLYIPGRDKKTFMQRIITPLIPTFTCVLQVHVNNLLRKMCTGCFMCWSALLLPHSSFTPVSAIFWDILVLLVQPPLALLMHKNHLKDQRAYNLP